MRRQVVQYMYGHGNHGHDHDHDHDHRYHHHHHHYHYRVPVAQISLPCTAMYYAMYYAMCGLRTMSSKLPCSSTVASIDSIL